jgi:hypothetical protein
MKEGDEEERRKTQGERDELHGLKRRKKKENKG